MIDAQTAEVDFDSPELAVTPGQAAVFYDGDRVLGGGFIAEAEPADVAVRAFDAAASLAP